MGLSGSAGVDRWRAAKFYDDPVYPNDCGWRGEVLAVLLMAIGCSIVEITSALVACAFVRRKVVPKC